MASFKAPKIHQDFVSEEEAQSIKKSQVTLATAAVATTSADQLADVHRKNVKATPGVNVVNNRKIFSRRIQPQRVQ